MGEACANGDTGNDVPFVKLIFGWPFNERERPS
jgi:hypothetical protein